MVLNVTGFSSYKITTKKLGKKMEIKKTQGSNIFKYQNLMLFFEKKLGENGGYSKFCCFRALTSLSPCIFCNHYS
jgi:hypothetical protein